MAVQLNPNCPITLKNK